MLAPEFISLVQMIWSLLELDKGEEISELAPLADAIDNFCVAL